MWSGSMLIDAVWVSVAVLEWLHSEERRSRRIDLETLACPRRPVRGVHDRPLPAQVAPLLLGVPLCLAAGWFELTRALGGREVAWVYAFEWPMYAVAGPRCGGGSGTEIPLPPNASTAPPERRPGAGRLAALPRRPAGGRPARRRHRPRAPARQNSCPSSASTATAENSRVRYWIEAWKTRVGRAATPHRTRDAQGVDLTQEQGTEDDSGRRVEHGRVRDRPQRQRGRDHRPGVDDDARDHERRASPRPAASALRRPA